jgi:hypothetical protein
MSSKSTTNQIKEIEEIVEKIKNKNVPNERDKETLLYKLNRQLTEEEHLHLFSEIIQSLDKKTYSITENCTLFDLNDLSPECFWKMFYYAQLSIHDHEGKKISDRARQEDNEEKVKMAEKMKAELDKFQADPDQAKPDVLDSLTPYERLRISALSQCQYSTYAKGGADDTNMALKDDKRMEKTIYSDTFQHRWKSDAVTTPNAPTVTMPKLKLKTTSEVEIPKIQKVDISNGNISDGEGDEDEDVMMNEDEFEEGETSESEIDRLKNQLLKMPKLTLKASHFNYEEADAFSP